MEARLEAKTDNAVGKLTTLTFNLRSDHAQSLFTVLQCRMALLFEYELQRCFLEDVAQAASRLDEALLEVARLCMPGFCPRDDISMQRPHLPARKHELAVHSRLQLALAAFIGSLCRAISRFLHARTRR